MRVLGGNLRSPLPAALMRDGGLRVGRGGDAGDGLREELLRYLKRVAPEVIGAV